MLQGCWPNWHDIITEMMKNAWEEDKGKVEALGHGNYRGLKLTDQAMKLLECVLDTCISEMMKIDEMQFGFVSGRGTTNASFVDSCRRSTLQKKNCSALPSMTLRKRLTMCQGRSYGGP